MRDVLFICGLLAVVGCKSTRESAAEKRIESASDEKARVDLGPSKLVALTSEGASAFGEEKAPEGFPLTVFAGGKIIQSHKQEGGPSGTVFVVMFSSKVPIVELAAYYEKELSAKGLKLSKAETSIPAMQLVGIKGESPAGDAVVQITKEAANPEATVTLNWSAKKS